MISRNAIAAGVLLALGLAQAHAESASKRVQCWTDSNGHRACGDAVPPQYAQQQRDFFDEQGRVRETKAREKTPEEVAADEKIERDKADAALLAQKQRDYDKFLMAAYSGTKDIERARDERLTMLDGRRKILERQIADNDTAIGQQQLRVDNASKDGKKPPAVLTSKLADLKQTRAANEKSLVDIAREKQKTSDKYATDLARFRELHSATAPAAAASVLPPPKP